MSKPASDDNFWDDAFENGAYIPGSAELAGRWATQAERFRAHCRSELDIPYGDHLRQRLDIFHPEGAARGTVIFVHGGYWLAFDKSTWSHFAAGIVARGWRVVMPSYRLAPEARLGQITSDICLAAVRVAEQYPGPLHLCGHSAGGHLCTRAAMDDSPLPPGVRKRIATCVPISGIFDLSPLIHTKMNERLCLDADHAVAQSPAFGPAPTCRVHAWVGANERPEFLRQTRLLAEAWGDGVQATYAKGRNHFTVLDALRDPHSDLVAEITRTI